MSNPTPYLKSFLDFAYDRSGNIAGINGVWTVPESFDPDAEYALFCADYAVKHTKKTGRSKDDLRKRKVRAWLRHMSARYEKVSFVHRED